MTSCMRGRSCMISTCPSALDVAPEHSEDSPRARIIIGDVQRISLLTPRGLGGRFCFGLVGPSGAPCGDVRLDSRARADATANTVAFPASAVIRTAVRLPALDRRRAVAMLCHGSETRVGDPVLVTVRWWH